MKKNILFLMLVSAAMLLTTSCVHEEDDIFDSSAAERLNAASSKYIDLLQGSEGGWLVEYYPTNDDAPTTGTGYLWLLKFNKDMSVNVGMNNYFSGNTYRECTSLWDVITDNGPVLTFNSYNPNVHAFSDPDTRSIPGSSDNVWGTGVGGDYEFVIVRAPAEDYPFMMLKGKKRGTYNRVTPMPAGTNFQEYLADVAAFEKKILPATAPNEKRLTIGENTYMFNIGDGIVSRYPAGGDAITQTTDHFYLITKRDGKYYFRFRNALSEGDVEEQEFVFDEEADKFVGTTHQENVIEGDDPTHFFDFALRENHSWVGVNGSAYPMSESVQHIYDAAAAALNATSSKWTFMKTTFTYEGTDSIYYNVTLRNSRRQNVTLSYAFSINYDGEKVALSFLSPVVTEKVQTAKTIYDATPEFKALVDSFTGTYKAQSETGSNFILSSIRLVDVADSNKWFTLNYASSNKRN